MKYKRKLHPIRDCYNWSRFLTWLWSMSNYGSRSLSESWFRNKSWSRFRSKSWSSHSSELGSWFVSRFGSMSRSGSVLR